MRLIRKLFRKKMKSTKRFAKASLNFKKKFSANTVQPPQGDPAMTLDFTGIPTAWTQGIEREQSSPSTRIACDPRLDDYMDNPPPGMPVYADVRDLEVAIATNPDMFQPYIPAPYKRIVFEFALCINVHKCPRPLPWSSWNCHCLGTGQANNDNLPLCNCGNGQTKRSRVQLCKDWDRDDSVTCESVGESIANNPILGTTEFPNRCINTINTQVWTQEFYGNQGRDLKYLILIFFSVNNFGIKI